MSVNEHMLEELQKLRAQTAQWTSTAEARLLALESTVANQGDSIVALSESINNHVTKGKPTTKK